jgi:hypothetical protein
MLALANEGIFSERHLLGGKWDAGFCRQGAFGPLGRWPSRAKG